MGFKFITSDEKSIIYAIGNDGVLRYFQDKSRNGSSWWANDGVGQSRGPIGNHIAFSLVVGLAHHTQNIMSIMVLRQTVNCYTTGITVSFPLSEKFIMMA